MIQKDKKEVSDMIGTALQAFKQQYLGFRSRRITDKSVDTMSVATNADLSRFAIKAGTSVTGSRGGNAALASLLTALAGEGLITDNTTP